MSSHVYHEIFLHLNWHTKDDLPLLQGEIEEACHRAIRDKCRAIRGVHVHQIGGTDDHVHVVVAIEPAVTISELLQEIKGFSSFEVNRRTNRKSLQWQRGYGVVSFGRAHLAWGVDYVARQREHHAAGKIEPRLEICDSPEFSKPAQAGGIREGGRYPPAKAGGKD